MVLPDFIKGAGEELMSPLHEKFTLLDLLGVRNRGSAGTWSLGAFRELPGENCSTVLKCT